MERNLSSLRPEVLPGKSGSPLAASAANASCQQELRPFTDSTPPVQGINEPHFTIKKHLYF